MFWKGRFWVNSLMDDLRRWVLVEWLDGCFERVGFG